MERPGGDVPVRAASGCRRVGSVGGWWGGLLTLPPADHRATSSVVLPLRVAAYPQPCRHRQGAVDWTALHMVKATTESFIAAGISIKERILLFCLASDTDPFRAGVTSETITAARINGFVDRNAAGDLALTESGRAVLRAMLPDL